MEKKFLLPDRYEGLEVHVNREDIPKIIIPVKSGIDKVQDIYEEMCSSNRGAFLILKGKSGCGKTTFLRTLDLFFEKTESITMSNDVDVVQEIKKLEKTEQDLRVVIIEGKESIIDSNNQEITMAIHVINSFIRTAKGKNTLIVWPCNDDDIIEILVDTSRTIGGTSLLGLEETYFSFHGPDKSEYLKIAKQTVESLNDGKTLLDFGIDDSTAKEFANESNTIGEYLKKVNSQIRKNNRFLSDLKIKEKCKMWVIVLATNEPSKDVEALTKGEFLDADIQRLMVSTGANIVKDIKTHSEHIGLLSNYLDCKIIYMPIVTALSIVRTYANDDLAKLMKANGMSTKKEKNVTEKVLNTELARMIKNDCKLMGTKGKTGNNSFASFDKLVNIATTNDRILNITFGEALKEAGLIIDYKPEQDFGEGLTRRTDLLCELANENLRLEFMWRRKTAKAEIANYTLTKLYNYGKALGFLK